MSDVKWIKVRTDIFNDEKFDAIKTLPDKNDIQLVWIKLLCLAGQCNESGLLMLTTEIPYTDEMMAKRFDMDVGVVQRALSVFQSLGMIDVEDNIYMVSSWNKHQSEDRLEEIRRKDRERKKEQRDKQRELIEQKRSMDIPRKNPRNCSYSLSNKEHVFSNFNNLDNYKYLITNNVYKDSSYIKDRPELDAIISDWMTYKDGVTPKNKGKYVSQMSMSKVLTMVINHDKEYGTDAVREAVDMSIANQWVGIYWDKIEKRGYSKPRSEPRAEMPTGLEKPKSKRQ
jgi:predicted phage replisome organizer